MRVLPGDDGDRAHRVTHISAADGDQVTGIDAGARRRLGIGDVSEADLVAVVKRDRDVVAIAASRRAKDIGNGARERGNDALSCRGSIVSAPVLRPSKGVAGSLGRPAALGHWGAEGVAARSDSREGRGYGRVHRLRRRRQVRLLGGGQGKPGGLDQVVVVDGGGRVVALTVHHRGNDIEHVADCREVVGGKVGVVVQKVLLDRGVLPDLVDQGGLVRCGEF